MASIQYEEFDKIKIQNPIDPELFGTIAEKAAGALYDRDSNKSSQIRRFYDELVLWDDKIQSKEEDKRAAAFEEALPYIQMIRAKLAYSGGRKARGKPLLTEDFVLVFSKLIKQIDSPQTLKNAKLFFEAYLGFAKALET